ncbi:phosphoenolpyruvate--protein phosphotransferase [Sanguibacter keddieii DSM 10542]|uniref:Phosphoenolpyruvate-protein phosphotransferase n=1 Tax=Sanguibacter keddieii (strain ATCC 51767 / DSM 10542 / NCFB 3025 / ST-74) TaxID=446469 RepID=D1BJW6_SANKS|nr:phosphoenolpyruvate--protein phosphotransferase [Sanguibacter keddieii]ACZ22375.1 phosphoenolpyruvate--protein phosphotransferase [Sanguibacter keddieii DSM 10542]
MNTPSPRPSTRTVSGIGVCAGLVAGPVVHMPLPIAEPSPGLRLSPREDHAARAAEIQGASDHVAADLDAAAERATGEARAVLEATAAIAADPTLVADAQRRVVDDYLVPERAVWEAAAEVAEQFEALGGYFAERVSDVHDIRDRLVAHLTGRPKPGLPSCDTPFVLVAYDLAPSVTASLDPAQVVAIVTDGAGPTSHTAIVANAKGIPAVVAAQGAHDLLEDGHFALVNGSTGLVVADPTEEELTTVRAVASRVRTFDGEGRTRDGHRVQLLANIGDPSDAEPAAQAGAEGVGLFRSEFCFLDREQPPTVDEQVEAYRRVFSAFPGRKVVIRTLDSGADKPLAFLTSDDEENPALGVRGLRTAKRSPELLDQQLEAVARAAAAEEAEVWVMAPMVSTVSETEEFVAACTAHGLAVPGVMVEVPSAALLAGPILARAHFASIGTNDLTQYTMAADRLLGSLAELSDPWQPAVLQLVAATCAGGAQQGRPVGVCGEAASNPVLAVVLVGLGISSLSMTARAIPDVAAVLAEVDLTLCQELARLAVSAETAHDARALVRSRLPVLAELGL